MTGCILQKRNHHQKKEVKGRKGAGGECLMSGDSNRMVGAGIMPSVKIFMKKKNYHSCHFPLIVIIISFPNCMCNTMSFHNALMGSPLL